MEEPITSTESDGYTRSSFYATSPYDTVKIAFFQHYLKVNQLYEICLDRILKDRDDRIEHQFKAGIKGIYLDLFPKIKYTEDPQFEKLKELNNLSPTQITFTQAEQYFYLLRELLEIDGITKYEFEKPPASQAIVRGMGRKT